MLLSPALCLCVCVCVCEYLLCLVQSWSLTLEVYWQAEQASEWEFGFGISLLSSGFSSCCCLKLGALTNLKWFSRAAKETKPKWKQCKICVKGVSVHTVGTQSRKEESRHKCSQRGRKQFVTSSVASICKRYERAIDLNFHVLNAIIWHRNRQKKKHCMHRINGQLSGENTQVANDTDGSSCC